MIFESNHTEGNWWVDNNREILGDMMGIRKVGKLYAIHQADAEEYRANAKLISNSPKLLEAFNLICAAFGDVLFQVEIEELIERTGLPKERCEEIKVMYNKIISSTDYSKVANEIIKVVKE